jgi:hypothetical protein
VKEVCPWARAKAEKKKTIKTALRFRDLKKFIDNCINDY